MLKTWIIIVALCFLGSIVVFVTALASSMMVSDPPDYATFLFVLSIILFIIGLAILLFHLFKKITEVETLTRAKKIIISVVILVVLLITILFLCIQIFDCSNPASSIAIGTWTEKGTGNQVVFEEDSSFKILSSQSSNQLPDNTIVASGTWKTSGRSRIVVILDSGQWLLGNRTVLAPSELTFGYNYSSWYQGELRGERLGLNNIEYGVSIKLYQGDNPY
jgi:hypothetical protein